MQPTLCPLCQQDQTSLLTEYANRPYYRCHHCALVFVPKAFHISAEEEKSIYDQHENNPDDPGYRNFLNRLMAPLLTFIPATSHGLDFGSGPGPTLSVMLEEQGMEMAIFDPFFANEPKVLEKQFDFITTTEVVEHLSDPHQVFELLFSRLNPNGVLGVMTKLIPSLDQFEQWHYIKDPTHITFYAEETFKYLAQQYGYTAHILRSDVIIMTPQTLEA